MIKEYLENDSGTVACLLTPASHEKLSKSEQEHELLTIYKCLFNIILFHSNFISIVHVLQK